MTRTTAGRDTIPDEFEDAGVYFVWAIERYYGKKVGALTIDLTKKPMKITWEWAHVK
jgi:hypothetical protein